MLMSNGRARIAAATVAAAACFLDITATALAQSPRPTPWQRGDFPPYYGQRKLPDIRELRRGLPPYAPAIPPLTSRDRREVARLAARVIETDLDRESSGRLELPRRGRVVIVTAFPQKPAAAYKDDTALSAVEGSSAGDTVTIDELPQGTMCRRVDTRLEGLPRAKPPATEAPMQSVSIMCSVSGVWKPARR